MSVDVARLIRSRQYARALEQVDNPATIASESERLRLRRQCLARMRRFEEAAVCGQALLRHVGSMAEAEDYFRQSQLLLECRRWSEALETALRAAAKTPGDDRLAIPLAHAVLAESSLFDRLAEGLSGLPPDDNHHAVTEQAEPRTSSRWIFVPLRLPYYRPYDGAHPGTMGMVERAVDLGFHIPDRMPAAWRDTLLPALRHALTIIEPLMAIHPVVDRAAAARYVADRLPSLMADSGGARIDFLSNLPMTLGQRPWVLWFDVLGTLFQPFQPLEETCITRRTPCYWIIRAFLESKGCLRIITHYPIDNHPLDTFFNSRSISGKLVFINPSHTLGNPATPPSRPAPAIGRCGRKPVRMLFTSSFQSRDEGFFHRGGVDALAAFLELAQEHEDVELVIRAKLPLILGDDLRTKALEHPRILWIENHMPSEDYRALMASADLFLLPAVVLFRNGLAQAMEAGQVPVVADVAGVDSLVHSGENGIVVPGRRTLTTLDGSAGILRHNWVPLLQAVDAPADPAFYAAFTNALRHLLANRSEIQRMSERNLTRLTQAPFPDDFDRFQTVMTDALRIVDGFNSIMS
jgi:glycosyltransferase involved in cell wall biosynthesis